MQSEGGGPAVFLRRVFLMLRVAIVSAAEEGEIPIRPPFRLWRRIGDERTIGVVREIETAGSIQTFDGRVGVNLEPRDKDRPIHNELQRAEFWSPVEDALNERGVIRAAAFGHITVELRTRLAGDDDMGICGRCGV